MVRNEFYKDFYAECRRLLPEVKHIGWWNHNVEFIDQEEAWECPAVFVEFGDIEWKKVVEGSYVGKGEVRLHVVTNVSAGLEHQLENIVTGMWVSSVVLGMSGSEYYSPLRLLSTLTNHNHEELIEGIEVIEMTWIRERPDLMTREIRLPSVLGREEVSE